MMENITFFDFMKNLYEEMRDVGATKLKTSKLIASHMLEQLIPTTSHSSQKQRPMEFYEDV